MDIFRDIFITILIFYVSFLHKKVYNLELRHKVHIDTHIDEDINFSQKLIRNIDKKLKDTKN